MFDQLFSSPRAVQRYLSAPLLEPRLRFLHHWRAQGATTATLRKIAFYQYAISRSIDLQSAGAFRAEQIREAADRWTSRAPTHHAQKNGDAAKVAFMSVANGWLSFLGCVEKPHTPECPGARFITEYADFMRSERGLSPLTVYTRCNRLEEFLGRFCSDAQGLRQMTIAQIDQAIAQKGTQDGCTRTSIRTYAYILRSFFRYAETRGWCAPGLAAGILPPRVYTGELLPAGPTWEDVQRLCAGAERDRRAQIRDRAILLLFSVYGWRAGEVRRLRLEDRLGGGGDSRHAVEAAADAVIPVGQSGWGRHPAVFEDGSAPIQRTAGVLIAEGSHSSPRQQRTLADRESSIT